MSYRYVVLGAGRQGTAAAYDLARWGDARSVVLADLDPTVARRGAERVDQLLGSATIEPVVVDVTDIDSLTRLLRDADAALSAAPYRFNLAVTQVAIESSTHLCDLGGHTGIARQQHGLAEAARRSGVSIVPNCGQVPGMGTSFMVRAVELLDEAQDVYMWDGGLPARPRPPFNYLLTFNMAGLTNEYAEPAVYLRDGKIVEVEPMTELETVEFPQPIGTLEAFVTGGGTDTMPWTYHGTLRTLQNKTLRWPGHFAQLRAFYDLGLWDNEPIRAGGVEVEPRALFDTLFEPRVTFPGDDDIILLRVQAEGTKNGTSATSTVELIDRPDSETGFNAMERCTGWSAAIVLEMAARGDTPLGAGGVEVMVPSEAYIDELRRRGIDVTEGVT